jgi:DNA modification methylase
MTEFGFDPSDFGLPKTLDDVQEVDVPEDAPAVCKRGDVWQLGDHRLMCGDSTDSNEIDRLLDGAFMRMTVTSPPYGVGKDYEEKGIEPWRKTIGGVINAIKGKSLIVCWNIVDLFSTGTQFSEPTGAYSIQMFEDAGYGMLYNRIWKKPGANFAGNNPYYTVTTKPAQDYEYLYAFAEKDADKRLDGLKRYLFGEAQKAGLNNSVISSIGGPKFMYGHWFTNHQWAFIDEKNYNRIRSYCMDKNIDAFERDYRELRQEYLDNTIFSHALSENDFSEWGLYGVWEFNTVHERLGGHAAVYPIELPTRFIKMHSYEGNAILDPFGGTGTTLIACEQLNRTCYMMELDPHYCDVIIKRWEDFTGKKAEKVS